ncbi:hypothetical protein CIB84_011919 [Bambusicola thoracicus]|uniref:Uncharacterized protein n=1 Tax=Bambusicola thoracicus TaxID=9083 RepID=A0A2P4SJQ0_BAMTH|nr:hypothetical protein CIB84_011919 [Bambusicola thoracicus]
MRRRGGAEAAGRGDDDDSGRAAEQSAERPRRGWLGWCPRLRTVLLQLLLIYISVPFLVRLFPVILTKFVFLNFCEYPSTESLP